MPDALVIDEVAETLRSIRGHADKAARGEVEGVLDSDHESEDALVSVTMLRGVLLLLGPAMSECEESTPAILYRAARK